MELLTGGSSPSPSLESEINSSVQLFAISPVGRLRLGEWAVLCAEGGSGSRGTETTAEGPALSCSIQGHPEREWVGLPWDLLP